MTTSKKKVKTTFHIDKAIYTVFAENIKEIGLRRDLYLNRVLDQEITLLMQETPNSVRASQLLKLLRDARMSDRVKVSISLDKDLIDRMKNACVKVRVSRDSFLEKFLDFLNEGALNGSCASPLARIIDLIGDPRVDFYERIGGELGEISEYDDITGMTDEFVDEMISRLKE